MRFLLAEAQGGLWSFLAAALAARWTLPLAPGAAPRRSALHRGARKHAALLLTDIIDSTGTAAALGDARWADLLEQHDARVGAAVARCGGELVDLAGDGVLAAFDDARAALACAAQAHASVRPLRLCLRVGMHVGDIELRDGRAMGLAVHITARIAALAGPGETLVSAAAWAACGAAASPFVDRGEHALRGVPQPCRLFSLRCDSEDPHPDALPALAAAGV